jgi:uncharacterized protein
MTSNKNIFVDTGAWYAVADNSDQYHEKAAEHIKILVHDGFTMTTTNLVVHETFMLLSRRLSRKAGIRFLDEIYIDENISIKHSNEYIEQEAYNIARKYSDHAFSITDCVSFVVMKHEAIKRVFTFDKHFHAMHFSVEP